MTGAVIPDNADAVIMKEMIDDQKQWDDFIPRVSIQKNQNIREYWRRYNDR